MEIQEKKIDVIKITLTLDEAHELAMALDNHIHVTEKRKMKIAKPIVDLFEYFDGRML